MAQLIFPQLEKKITEIKETDVFKTFFLKYQTKF